MNAAIFALGLLLAGPAAAVEHTTSTLRGIDVYRSKSISQADVDSRFRARIQQYLALRADGKRHSLNRADALRDEILAELRGMADLAFAQMHVGEYFSAAGRSVYVTFDVVDRADAKTRMPFSQPPAGRAGDPAGLLAAYKEYNELGKALRSAAQLPFERPDCPAFFCSWGSQTPELAALEGRFVEGVEPNKKGLRDVLERDADPVKRANAVFLLSYMASGKDVVEAVRRALADPDKGVRDAALQVLSDIATYHREVEIPLGKITDVLDYPTTEDRGKALGVLIGLSDTPAYSKALLSDPPRRLLDLLRLSQPLCHDTAYTVLVLISKESFDRRDYGAWEEWISPDNARKRKAGVR